MKYGDFKDFVGDNQRHLRTFPLTNGFTNECSRGGFQATSRLSTVVDRERVCKNQADWIMKRI